jgi:hypothetical protein
MWYTVRDEKNDDQKRRNRRSYRRANSSSNLRASSSLPTSSRRIARRSQSGPAAFRRTRFNDPHLMRNPDFAKKALEERSIREQFGTNHMYGVYWCKKCNRHWNSGDTWENKSQPCRRCGLRVFPDRKTIAHLKIVWVSPDKPECDDEVSVA